MDQKNVKEAVVCSDKGFDMIAKNGD